MRRTGRSRAVRPSILLFVVVALAGCGAETAGTAATGAVIKAKEVEEGQKTGERARQKIDQAMDQLQQRAQTGDDAASR